MLRIYVETPIQSSSPPFDIKNFESLPQKTGAPQPLDECRSWLTIEIPFDFEGHAWLLIRLRNDAQGFQYSFDHTAL